MTTQLELPMPIAPDTGIVHVVLPNMSLACDPDFLAKPAGDRVLFGAATPDRWALVTCPWCHCQGRVQLADVAHRIQRRTA